MHQQVKPYRIFIASPGDLAEERRMLRDIVEQTTEALAKETDWRIELLAGEDTLPGVGRPQALINADVDKADLFIGCLWQRWGTPSGDGGKTGFEEEFIRASDNYKRTGRPEIWLFFKQVEPITLADPGDQLRKVLAFRASQVASKQLLFKEFRGLEDWQQLIQALLLRQTFRLLGRRLEETKPVVQGTTPPPSQIQVSELTGDGPKPPPKSIKSITSLLDLLKSAQEKLQERKLLAFTDSEPLLNSENARLLLFAATLYDVHEQRIALGSHEINSVYLHRDTLNLSNQERVFILQTVISDNSVTKPGWYWWHTSDVPFRTWVLYLMFNSGPEAQVEMIKLAARLEFPLLKGFGRKHTKPITRILNDRNSMVRQAGLECLAEIGTVQELRDILPLLSDPDRDVRSKADYSMRAIRLRTDPNGEFTKNLKQGDVFDQEIIKVLKFVIEQISEELLHIANQHSSGALRAMAAEELTRRGLVTDELASKFVKDDAKRVKQSGYLALIRNGKIVEPTAVKQNLNDLWSFMAPDTPDWNKADADIVIREAFDNLSVRDLWTHVRAFEQHSPLALEVIGRRFYSECVDELRQQLNDDFQQMASIAKTVSAVSGIHGLISHFGGDTVESIRKRLRQVALEALANRPQLQDKPRFLEILCLTTADADETIQGIKAVASIGTAEDCALIKRFFEAGSRSVRSAAARAYLLLCPDFNSAVKELLALPVSLCRTWIVIALILRKRAKSAWPLLEPVLRNDEEALRRWTCYAATTLLSRSQLKALLGKYSGNPPYFYNVVALLDRALYSPTKARAFYHQDEAKQFRLGCLEATHGWPGLA